MFLVFIFALLLSNLILTNIFFQFQFTAMQSALFLKYVEVQSLNLPKKFNHIVIFRDALIAIFLANSDFFVSVACRYRFLTIPIFFLKTIIDSILVVFGYFNKKNLTYCGFKCKIGYFACALVC